MAGIVEHLVGLQAQAPLPPYLGLWSRLREFDPHELGRMLTDREVVRLALMRGMVHLVTPRDAVEAEAHAASAFLEPDHPRRVMLHDPVGA